MRTGISFDVSAASLIGLDAIVADPNSPQNDVWARAGGAADRCRRGHGHGHGRDHADGRRQQDPQALASRVPALTLGERAVWVADGSFAHLRRHPMPDGREAEYGSRHRTGRIAR